MSETEEFPCVRSGNVLFSSGWISAFPGGLGCSVNTAIPMGADSLEGFWAEELRDCRSVSRRLLHLWCIEWTVGRGLETGKASDGVQQMERRLELGLNYCDNTSKEDLMDKKDWQNVVIGQMYSVRELS